MRYISYVVKPEHTYRSQVKSFSRLTSRVARTRHIQLPMLLLSFKPKADNNNQFKFVTREN